MLSEYLTDKNGRRFISLKQILQEEFGLTPDEYRKLNGIPPGEPIVIMDYSKVRANLEAEQKSKGQ